MTELFLYMDRWLFCFINQSLANPVFDVLMPVLTDWNKTVGGWSVAIALWLLLMVKGGRTGRIIGILLIPMIIAGDRLSSEVLKGIVHRPRPCHTVGGLPVIEHIRLLVPCGSGYSFPSSHAFNNFALATYLTWYFRKLWWAWFLYAALMGLSRVVVGVHFPSDVAGGAILGASYAGLYLWVVSLLAGWIPAMRLRGPETPPGGLKTGQ